MQAPTSSTSGDEAGQFSDDSTSGPLSPATSAPLLSGEEKKSAPEKKPGFFTWERSIEIVKLVATIWVALLGSFVTVQFNERQHELNRIEAIAHMLPHIASTQNAESKDGGDDMSRDGAIWAIFRTANNRIMLRDLAALFPKDIYRVVSSIAIGGELDHDNDALTALQVSSEKLAAQYSLDKTHAEVASRLYAQALKLKDRNVDDTSPLRVVDLTTQMPGSEPTNDQLENLIKTVNNLADVHLRDAASISTKKKSGDSHWKAKELYLRARQLGKANTDPQVLEQVVRADIALASLYVEEQLTDDALKYLKEAFALESKISGTSCGESGIKELDHNNDGFANLAEVDSGIKRAQSLLKELVVKYPDKGASLK